MKKAVLPWTVFFIEGNASFLPGEVGCRLPSDFRQFFYLGSCLPQLLQVDAVPAVQVVKLIPHNPLHHLIGLNPGAVTGIENRTGLFQQ